MSENPQGQGSVSRWWRALGAAVTGALLLVVGLAGGWFAARQTAAPSHGEDGDHDAGRSHGPATPKISARTLANLGVEVKEAALSEFVRRREVPAVVALRPDSGRAAHTPVGGVVEEVLVVPGQVVAAGDVVARVRRDAFPRPTLTLTDAILRPLNEEFHDAVAEIRSSAQALSIARGELARVQRVLSTASGGGEPAVRSKVEVDLRNEELRALRALENARQEAERHGLTPEEVSALEAGGTSRVDLPPVERVLARNGLWSATASTVLAMLPESARTTPYASAVLGELVGSNALTPSLADALRTHPALAAAFLDVAGLVQQGWTTETLAALADAGALAAVVPVRAPAGAADWDVEGLRTRPGEHVDAGTALVEVRDLARMHLRLSPAGPDLEAIGAALSGGEPISAEPLVAGSAPTLEGLAIERLEAAEAGATHGSAIVAVDNEALRETKGKDGARFRSWALRPGLRYLVGVPVERRPGRFVLPADAVAARGPDTVVLLEDGAGFRPVAVRVEHRDARVVVVANDGAIFAGDRMIMKGAYAVLLAIEAASGGPVDPHAGHNH